MEILYITKTSVVDRGGGGETRAREVTKRLADRGHSVTILCGKTGPGLERWTEFNSCNVRHVTCVPDRVLRWPRVGFYAPRYLFAFVSFPLLLRYFITRESDVCIENMTPYPTLSIIAAKLFGIPIVAVQHEFHGWESFEAYDPLTGCIQIVVQNILRILEYDLVIVPTTYTKDRFSEYGIPPGRIRVIPNGINAEKYRKPTMIKDDHRLISIGRLTRRKGHDVVIRAFARISEEVPKAKLDILGTGPDKERLTRLAQELNVDDTVTFHGYVPEEEKIERLNRASVFIFGSRQEGFGLVLLEAMAAGVPIVATHLPVYGDLISDSRHGYLVPQEDHTGLAERVVELLNDRTARAEMGETGSEQANTLSWDSTAQDTEAALRGVVSQPRGKSVF